MLLVFFLGSINVFIGVAVAVVLQRRLNTLQGGDDHSEAAVSPELLADPEMKQLLCSLQSDQLNGQLNSSENLELPEDDTDIEEIPVEWIALLQKEATETSSFIEASVEVLKLEVGRYRISLFDIEDHLRNSADEIEASELKKIANDLIELNERWLSVQSEATGFLEDRQDNLGSLAEIGVALENTLLDQASQIESTCTNLQSMEFGGDKADGISKLTIEVLRLIDLAHRLRDQMNESAASIVRLDKKHDSLKPEFQVDRLTDIGNRNGVEMTFYEWWKDDVSRHRLLSVALIDVDGFSKINHKFSTRVGDKVLQAITPVLTSFMRKERGFDRIYRVDGQAFLLFLGDTGPKAASVAVERIRQNLEVTTFRHNELSHTISITSGVTDVRKEDDLTAIYQRLQKTTRAAKKSGRNTTFINDEIGPELFKPTENVVKERIVNI